MMVLVVRRERRRRRRRVVAGVLVMLIGSWVWIRCSCGEDDAIRLDFRWWWRWWWSSRWKGVAPPMSTASTVASAAADVAHEGERSKGEVFRETQMIKSQKVSVLMGGSVIKGESRERENINWGRKWVKR